MAFLYGDSTPSPLETNYLEFLRDALDFSVTVLAADSNIEKIRERKAQAAREAEDEAERLQTFGRVVIAAIEDAPKGDPDSETSRCAANLTALAAEAVIASTDAVQHALADENTHADADEAAQREASYRALETLLLPHAVPDSKVTRRLARQADGSYRATLEGSAGVGLDWLVALVVPEGHAFASPSPADRLAPQMEFFAPEQTGWLKKELKPRPQKLERFLLTEASDDGASVVLKLKAAAGDSGFDFTIGRTRAAVNASRMGKDGEGPFELAADDASKIAELAGKIRDALCDLKGERLERATLDSGDFRAHPVFRDIVERFVRQMAPVVQEIAKHSLTQTELVIRRLLSNERREEIFVTKKTLRDKFAPLPPEQRRLFDVFGFGTLAPPPPPASGLPPRIPTAPPPHIPTAPPQIVEADLISDPAVPADPAAVRTEVKPSTPPPPPSWVRPPRGSGRPPSGPTWRKPPPRSDSESPAAVSPASNAETPDAPSNARTTPEGS